MSKPSLIATENVRIDGQWRVVDVYVNTLEVACNMGPKAAATKSQRATARFGGLAVKVRPIDGARK
jgi:hypothetical protein